MPHTTAKAMDAIAFLKRDHRTVESLFEKFETSRAGSAKTKLAESLCFELMVHAQIEEEVFYPAIKDAIDEEIYSEAFVEHDGAKVLIAEILAGSPRDGFYDAKVKVLSEMIKHHVKEEEQRDGMFAQVRRGDVDLMTLGAALAARKDEVATRFRRFGVPQPKTRSMIGARLERGEPVEA
jgi:hemerythrin superfamily protein